MNWSKISVVAGVLSIPVLIVWYLVQFEAVLRLLPSGSETLLPRTALGAFLLFAICAIVALAIGQLNLAKSLAVPKTSDAAPAELIPYREWAQHLFRDTCRNGNHPVPSAPATQLDLVKHEGCSFKGCYLNWRGLACGLEGCTIFGTNQVTIELGDFAKTVSFFMRQAYVPRNATLG